MSAWAMDTSIHREKHDISSKETNAWIIPNSEKLNYSWYNMVILFIYICFLGAGLVLISLTHLTVKWVNS